MTACPVCRTIHPEPSCDGASVAVQTHLPSWLVALIDREGRARSRVVRDVLIRHYREAT